MYVHAAPRSVLWLAHCYVHALFPGAFMFNAHDMALSLMEWCKANTLFLPCHVELDTLNYVQMKPGQLAAIKSILAGCHKEHS